MAISTGLLMLINTILSFVGTATPLSAFYICIRLAQNYHTLLIFGGFLIRILIFISIPALLVFTSSLYHIIIFNLFFHINYFFYSAELCSTFATDSRPVSRSVQFGLCKCLYVNCSLRVGIKLSIFILYIYTAV